VPLEDEALADILGDRELKSDEIHPNAAGYQRLAEALYQLLQDSGALEGR
jgi:lysophospholipase L1-like esterase